MSLDIRSARASDLDALAAIENTVFPGDRISRRSFRSFLHKDSAALLVAVEKPDIAGYCVVLFRTGVRMARLYSIAAAPGRRGVGAALLEAAETEAARRGATAMRLEVRADNPRAIALYERSGYGSFATVEDYYEDGQLALRFEKPLAPPARPSGPPGVASRPQPRP